MNFFSCCPLIAIMIGSCLCLPAWAQQVGLAGVSGGKALLVVDGQAPKFVEVGQSHLGVKLLQAQGSQAKVQVQGHTYTMNLGDVPVSTHASASSASKSGRIVITAESRGHFMTSGLINGKTVMFMVDTGASSIAMSQQEASRLGIMDAAKAQNQVILGNTANGTVQGYRTKIKSVRIGDVEVYDVDAAILPQPMNEILLGNSFLNRFQMQRNNDQMVLERRY